MAGKKSTIQEPFVFENGYELRIEDLGAGITISLRDTRHEDVLEDTHKVLLRTASAIKLVDWLSRTQGQSINHIPPELKETLKWIRGQHKAKKLKLPIGGLSTINKTILVMKEHIIEPHHKK